MPTRTYTFAHARAPHHSHREEGGRAHERQQAHKSHQSVMVHEVITLLEPHDGEVVVDATFGTGGHSRALQAAAHIQLIAIDADPRLPEVIEGNFADLSHVLKKSGVQEVNKVLFDLGWNREQLLGKGFSLLVDEPLNMSYGTKPASGFTARDIVNEWDEKVLADVLYGYG